MKEKRLKIIVEGRINSKEMGDVKGGCDCGCEPDPCESLKAYFIKPIDPCTISLTKYAIIVDPCIKTGYYCTRVLCANDPKPIYLDM